MNEKPSRRDANEPTENGDVEIHVCDNTIFQRTLEEVIRSSRESQRGIFLSGTYGRHTSYFVLCLTSDQAEHVIAAQDLIEHLLCAPNPILDSPRQAKAETRIRNRRRDHGDPSLN